MTNATYKKQAGLLLEILPEVAKEECFAMHGGTAINLFVRDMPRLSVDIDLTYLPIEDRPITLKNIAAALIRIKERIEKRVPGIRIQHKEETGKLLISKQGIDIKLEVNLVGRGTFISSDVRAVIFDGGIPNVNYLNEWVTAIDPPGIGKAKPGYLEHGLAVTSAFLFGHITGNNLPRPFCNVDHVRVLDEHTGKDANDFEILDVLDRILGHLNNNPNKYQFSSHIGGELSPRSIRALMIHRAACQNKSRRDVGWGKFETDVGKLITCDDNEALVVYQGELPIGEHLRAFVPIPKDLKAS